jgi:hypothetical protein
LHIEFLVEELSAQEFLNYLLPKILRADISYKIHPFRGKSDLLSKLPNRLKGYKACPPDEYKIVILIDKDDDDCCTLKKKLEQIASNIGFTTKSSTDIKQTFQVLNRIAVEELEAWYFGDNNAITTAYPKVSKNLANQSKYRIPDEIKGGTWEALERILQKAGYHQGGLEKVKAARQIAIHMNPKENKSSSFQAFYQGLLQLIV